ncbi:MAG: hypothetical protein K1W41_14530 [Lachnospiraceae bacterium]
MKKVKSIHEDQYIIFDNTAKHLLDLGFKYDSDEDKYTYNFSALKYEKTTVLRGIITAYTNTDKIKIDVKDNNFIPYAPFYNIECGNYDVILNKINKAILNEFSKFKISKRMPRKDDINED